MAKSSPAPVLDEAPLVRAPDEFPVDRSAFDRQAADAQQPQPVEVHEVPLMLEPGKDYAVPTPRGLFQVWHLRFKHFETGQTRSLYVPGHIPSQDVATLVNFAEKDPDTKRAVEGLTSRRIEYYLEPQKDLILKQQRRPEWALNPAGDPVGRTSYGFGGYDPIGDMDRLAKQMGR